MKLRSVSVMGFRGAKAKLDLSLPAGGVCILAENGHGKTTIVDALEFWGSGGIAHLNREGCQLDSAVNVDSGSAEIVAETTHHSPLKRSLNGRTPSSLQPMGPVSADIPLPSPLPILRHRTMADFMNKSAGEKLKAVLELVGLQPLNGFRQEFVTAVNNAKGAAEAAERTNAGEQAALATGLAGRPVFEVAEELRVRAGLVSPISSDADIAVLEFANALPIAQEDLATQLADLARAAAECQDDFTGRWNRAIDSPGFVSDAALQAFLETADRLLPMLDGDTCPLCGSPVDLEELKAGIAPRLDEVVARQEEHRGLRADLSGFIERCQRLTAAATTIAANLRITDVNTRGDLRAVARDLSQYVECVQSARDSVTKCLEMPEVTSRLHLDELALVAKDAAQDSGAPAALAKLAQLKEQQARTERSVKTASARRQVADDAAAVLTAIDEGIRIEIEAVLAKIGPTAANYYGRLVGSPVYSDLEFRYKPERSGGVEFVLKFDGRHEISPPQRILSESQLNALGLSLFLAQLKVGGSEWRTIVLDDVVNSFDASHRLGLAQLLVDEFADWQPLVFTHDRMFFELARRIAPFWSLKQIVAWTPAGGPVIDEGDMRELLRRRIAEGRGAAELGGLARSALEQALSRPLERLELPIRFDPFARYSAKEYLDALHAGLRAHNSSLADAAVLRRMDAESYIVNLGAHDRVADPSLTVGDLSRLVCDLDELDAAFRCADCGKPVWAAERTGHRHQCQCGKLVA
jgi:hypothetical protein